MHIAEETESLEQNLMGIDGENGVIIWRMILLTSKKMTW